MPGSSDGAPAAPGVTPEDFVDWLLAAADPSSAHGGAIPTTEEILRAAEALDMGFVSEAASQARWHVERGGSPQGGDGGTSKGEAAASCPGSHERGRGHDGGRVGAGTRGGDRGPVGGVNGEGSGASAGHKEGYIGTYEKIQVGDRAEMLLVDRIVNEQRRVDAWG